MADTRPPRYWHGGAPDLKPGDLITPRPAGDLGHLRKGCPTCEARREGAPLDTDVNDPAFVYVTTNRDYARLYATGYPLGDLYRVEPLGDLIETTGRLDPVPSWAAPAARVIAVYDRAIRLSLKQATRLATKAARG